MTVIVLNVTVTVALPDTFVYPLCVEVAVIVAVVAPVPAGVKVTAVPELTLEVALNVPAVEGLTERFTVFANAPVPMTVGVQFVVCRSVMDDGLQTIDTLVTVIGTVVTVTVTLPDLVESCVEVAVHVAVPTAVGVSTPEEVIVPPVAVQVTPELYAPAPTTVAVQVAV